MRRTTSSILGLIAIFASLALAPSNARAVGITPDPLDWDLSGQGAITTLLGSVDFLGAVTGTPSGGTVLDGTVGASDITLIFQHSLDPSNDPALDLPDLFLAPDGTAVMTASGTIAGPDADVLAGGSVGRWTFANPNGFEAGETLDPIFVSFSTLTPGDELAWGFVLIEMGIQTVAVPEPGSAMLVLSGLGLLAWSRRRQAS